VDHAAEHRCLGIGVLDERLEAGSDQPRQVAKTFRTIAGVTRRFCAEDRLTRSLERRTEILPCLSVEHGSRVGIGSVGRIGHRWQHSERARTLVPRPVCGPIASNACTSVTVNVGTFIAISRSMAMTTSNSSRDEDLLRRACELGQRWLPMLLTRLSIENDVITDMRSESGNAEELLRRLEVARVATETVARGSCGETQELAHSALELIAELARGTRLIRRDAAAADRALSRVNTHLLGVLVGLPSSTVRAGLAPSSWWARLLAVAS
jgi:hypothetical protein